MDDRRPAISLVAVPGKRKAAIEAGREADQRGFAGIACPSIGGAMGLCASLAHVTETIPFWTSIQPIYLSTPARRRCSPATSPRSAAAASPSASASATARR